MDILTLIALFQITIGLVGLLAYALFKVFHS